MQIFIPFEDLINIEEEIARLEKWKNTIAHNDYFKDKDYKHCSMLVYRWTQVRDLRLFI